MILSLLKTLMSTAKLALKTHHRQQAITKAMTGIIETLVVIIGDAEMSVEGRRNAFVVIAATASDFASALEKENDS